MNSETSPPGLEVRTYFVRGRNALVARADFGELYVDYYLHQGQHGQQHAPAHDAMLKEALAALTLHCAARPWNESWAWTLHFAEPLLNLFVTGDNRRGMVVGQLFTEGVKADHHGRFVADVVRERGEPRRSVVEFAGAEVFPMVEHFYTQSEQRPARFFRHGPERATSLRMSLLQQRWHCFSFLTIRKTFEKTISCPSRAPGLNTRYAALPNTGWVQCEQRRASIGISLRHSGHFLVVGSGGVSPRFMRATSAFTGTTTKK